MKRILGLGFLCTMLVALGVGCSSSNNGQSGGNNANGSFFGPQPTVDLAVSDPVNGQVAVYLDVLNFLFNGGSGFPSPDMAFDAVGSGLGEPGSVYLTNDDLVICDGTSFAIPFSGNNEVYIYRNYRNHVTGAVPDIIFTNGGTIGTIDDPIVCLVDEEEDDLIVAEFGSNEIQIVRDFSALADGTDPAATVVTLDNTTSLVDGPINVVTSGDDLYVANLNATAPGDPCVTIYRDVSLLVNANPPDVRLDIDVSFFDLLVGIGLSCTGVNVGNNPFDATDSNALYVSTLSGGLFVFLDADNLTTNALPDAVIFGAGTGLGIFPFQPLLAGNRIYVPNLNGVGGGTFCFEAPGVTGFDSVGNFTTGQPSSFQLDGNNADLVSAHQLDLAGNALFAAGDHTCLSGLLGTGDIWIFANGLSIDSSFQPGILIPGELTVGTESIAYPAFIDARERDQGT